MTLDMCLGQYLIFELKGRPPVRRMIRHADMNQDRQSTACLLTDGGLICVRPHRSVLSLRPRLSARKAETKAFMLTPSCLARAVSRACKLRGMRAINFPLGNSPGRGISRSSSLAALIQAETASRPLTMASSGVSPSDMQPGKSGKTINQPPPSSFSRGRSSKG
jgi:uncharacterized heparinase superfamily protein